MISINRVKQTIKHCIQLIALGFGRHNKKHNSPQLVVLMYHRILPKDDIRCQTEEPGMIVTPETFRKQLQILSKYFEFISLSDWIEKKENHKPLPNMACAITFDDGWHDNYEFAYPILKDLGIPATIYLVANMIGTEDIFWPERISHTVTNIAKHHSDLWSSAELTWLRETQTDYNFDHNTPNKDEISQIIHSLKKYSDNEINLRLKKLEGFLSIKSFPAAQRSILNWQQVNEMVASGVIEIGSHTCQHIRLNNKTSNETLKTEIIKSKSIINENTDTEIKTFCFPNGDYSDAAVELVKKNYIGSVTTQPGWNSDSSDNYLLQRVAIHEDISNTAAAFLSRISGWT